MQRLLSSWRPPYRWWLLGTLGAGTLLALLLLVRNCPAQAPSPERAQPAPEATAVAPLTLRWNYTPAAPEQFVVRRSLDGATWQDVAVLPGASGTGLTWEDTTLPASEAPVRVRYLVYAVAAGNVWSAASNMAQVTVGEEPPIALGECVAVKRGKKKVLITCTQE